MAEPPWARWVFVTVLGAVTLYFLLRLALAFRLRLRGVRGRTDVHVDAALVLMGSGMTAMFLADHSAWSAPWWGALFAADAAWLGVLAVRAGRHTSTSGATPESPGPQGYLHHAVANLAMLYMVAAPQATAVVTHVQAAAVPVALAGHAHGSHGADGSVAVQNSQGLAFPLLAWLLMLYFALGAGWAGADLLSRWLRPAHGPVGGGAVLSAAPPVIASELVMALSMAYMLFVML